MKALFTLLFLIALNVNAQTKLEINDCSNPDSACWVKPINSIPPPTSIRICPAKTMISKIAGVYKKIKKPMAITADYMCVTYEQKYIDCSQIVYYLGTDIVEEEIKITTHYNYEPYPGCHILGGCKRCMERSTYIELVN